MLLSNFMTKITAQSVLGDKISEEFIDIRAEVLNNTVSLNVFCFSCQDADLPLRKPAKPITGSKDSVASVSSIDQTSISALDLAIATSVEKEVRHGVNHIESKPEASQAITVKQPKVGGGKKDSPTAAVSALDHIGVSSVDLDIAASVEKEAEPVMPAKVPEVSKEGIPEKEIDAGSHGVKGLYNKNKAFIWNTIKSRL